MSKREIGTCTRCKQRQTRREVCAVCKFEAARQVPQEVVDQLKEEAEAQELARERSGPRRAYTVRTSIYREVVIVQYSHSPAPGQGVTYE